MAFLMLFFVNAVFILDIFMGVCFALIVITAMAAIIIMIYRKQITQKEYRRVTACH